MKQIFIGLVVAFMDLSNPGLFAAGSPDKKMPELSKEERQSRAEMHEKMAECLRSDKPMKECHDQMMKDCPMAKEGHCPMMEGMHHKMRGHMHGKGMLNKGDAEENK